MGLLGGLLIALQRARHGGLERDQRLALLLIRCLAVFVSIALAAILSACARPVPGEAGLVAGGDAARGRARIAYFGCGSCHTIPGIPGANATVGPPLAGIARRTYIAGVLPNSPDNIERWIQNPKAVDEKTAMPVLGVGEQDARDIAAYLYTLRPAR